MRILIFNWRDIKNPTGGGAEVLTHEMGKRWVRWGHKVVQFSSWFAGSKKEEIVDGVKIIRRGSANIRSFTIPVHLAAFFWYQREARGKFDVVIDEIHGIPFFTPWYVKEKKVALICEVAGQLWDVVFRFPLNKIGRFIESNYFHFYKTIPFLTISSSTKKELQERGLAERNITVLPMGITLPKNLKNYPKEKKPTLIFVARLSKAKGIEDAIETTFLLKKTYPEIKLWVVGQKDGQYQQELENKAKKLNLEKDIIFFGFVSQEKKFELLSRAHLLVTPSIKEGWGLTVPEAGSCGTPAVGYNSPGLRDVLQNNKFGIIVKENTPNSLAKEIKELLVNQKLYSRLAKEGAILSKSFSWDKTARVALNILGQTINE